MACAGYLVWNNTAVVYAEITNGLLVCCSAAPSVAATCEETPALLNDESAHATSATPRSTNMLPLLAPKHMTRSESPAGSKLKRRLAQPQPEEEDDVRGGDDGSQRDSWASGQGSEGDEDQGARVLRLCGHAIDVVDCEDDCEDAQALPPFSFRVNTKKLTFHEDATVSAKRVDSLVLSAVDQKAKDEWMKRLARWNRYGWRETTYIAAAEADREALKLTVKRWQDALARAFSQSFASTPMRSSRRRFYRSSVMGNMEESMVASDPWFNMRVVKSHI